ncbi:hypothetical protein VNI00_008220 [Paramarasmius palmivorus]|uniref:Zn(2)-C6 fungal-type domain-containing protein n=1 Tax=Paramarasmius palmivorus TaxID=297713 RepID=A0AAW0CXR2_9AGAR
MHHSSSRSHSYDIDSDSSGIAENTRPRRPTSAAPRPRTGACVHCKSLKVRCEFNPGENSCQRCQAGSMECVPRTRKKRKPAPTHEDLQERAHDQDAQIQALLLQFDKMKHAEKVERWIRTTMKGELGRSTEVAHKPKWNTHNMNSSELAVTSYYPPDPAQHYLNPPDIVKHCLLFPQDIARLFEIYFDKVNSFFSILDPELHTPEKLIWSSPFLFTVICAIASRYYTARPDIYMLAQEFARDAAGKALIEGQKSIEMCQAYLLLAVYPVPKKKWAEDRSWLLMGVAIRMAIELELDQPPPPDCDERQALNRTRTWLNCYCVDGSHAIQFGKLPMLRLDGYLARTSQNWYRSSLMNIAYDIHLCAYVQMIVIMARWRSLVADGGLKGDEIVSASLDTSEELAREIALWVAYYNDQYRLTPLITCAYRGYTTRMITAYLRLVVLATGFQHAYKSGITRNCDIFSKSIEAAKTVIQIMVDHLYPMGRLQYAMEANFLYVSFAAAYLVNLLRPKFLPLLDENQQDEIIRIVEGLIEVLRSKQVALDGRHTPALYSRFLSSLLAKYNIPPRERCFPTVDGTSIYPQYSAQRGSTPPNTYLWPEVYHNGTSQGIPNVSSSGPSEYTVYQQSGDADMDLSPNHFIKTVTQNASPSSFLNQSASQSWPHYATPQAPPWSSFQPFGG